MSAPRRKKGTPYKNRPHHRAFYALPKDAQELAVAGFRANETNAAIIDAILAQHSATITEASLNRYRLWWEATQRPALEAAERAEELVRAFRNHPTQELEQLIQQLLRAQRLTAMTEDKKLDPIKLGTLDLEERRLRLEERRVVVREKALQLKVDEVARSVDRALRDSKGAGGLTDEVRDRIRTEIYGLAPRAAAATPPSAS